MVKQAQMKTWTRTYDRGLQLFQEEALITYVNKLNNRGFPFTPQILKNSDNRHKASDMSHDHQGAQGAIGAKSGRKDCRNQRLMSS
jgi:hypothetical protein